VKIKVHVETAARVMKKRHTMHDPIILHCRLFFTCSAATKAAADLKTNFGGEYNLKRKARPQINALCDQIFCE